MIFDPNRPPGQDNNSGAGGKLPNSGIKALIADLRETLEQRHPEKKDYLSKDENIIEINDLANDIATYHALVALRTSSAKQPKLLALADRMTVRDQLNPDFDPFKGVDDSELTQLLEAAAPNSANQTPEEQKADKIFSDLETVIIVPYYEQLTSLALENLTRIKSSETDSKPQNPLNRQLLEVAFTGIDGVSSSIINSFDSFVNYLSAKPEVLDDHLKMLCLMSDNKEPDAAANFVAEHLETSALILDDFIAHRSRTIRSRIT